MKKSLLLLSLVLIPPIGCSKIKTPEFKRHSNSVTNAEFVAGFDEKQFASYLVFSSSRKGSSYHGVQFSSSQTLGDVSISDSSGTSENEISFAFDSSGNRSTIKEKGESNVTSTGAEKDEQRVSKLSTSIQYQFNDALNSFVYIDTNDKTYKKYDNSNITDSILYAIDSEYLNFYTALKQYESLSEEKQSGYGFFIDGGVYTMSYSVEETKTNIGNNPDTVAVETKYNIDSLYQMEINDGKFSFRSKTVSKIVTRYYEAYSGHLAGEISVSDETDYSSLDITISSVTIKAIDISSYVSLDKDPNGGK